jgi:type VI secretion system protein ImpC
MDFEINFAKPEAQPVVRERLDGPMRILIAGDFSGRANRGLIEHGDGLAERPTPTVDVDNFDELLFRFSPRLVLPMSDPGAPGMQVEFRRMEDFHPDGLFERLEVFRALREMRGRLLDPRTFAQEAEELKRIDGPSHDHPPAAQEEAVGEDDGDMFERLLGRKPTDAPRARAGASPDGVDITPFIRKLVQPYVVASPGQQDHLIASVDEATGMQMREVLHDPTYQGLESAWRGVEWLLEKVETSENLDLCLLDVTKDELIADLGSTAGDLTATGLYRLLVEKSVRTPGAPRWAMIAGNYSFGTGAEDVALLGALGVIASAAGAPFVAAADPSIIGCRSPALEPDPRKWHPLDDETATRWASLRAGSAAQWVGLALPRFLLRLPYGARTEPAEAFAFEEMESEASHDSLLWGNPALACAMLIAAAFAESGWSMQPGDYLQIDDLPAYSYDEGGETVLKAVAEAYLTETAAEQILERGLMPLLSYRNRNAARLMRFQSLAHPAAALQGPWG